MPLLPAFSAQHLNISRCPVQKRHPEDFCFKDCSNPHVLQSEMCHCIGIFSKPTTISFSIQTSCSALLWSSYFVPLCGAVGNTLTVAKTRVGQGLATNLTGNTLVGEHCGAHVQEGLKEERKKQQGLGEFQRELQRFQQTLSSVSGVPRAGRNLTKT